MMRLLPKKIDFSGVGARVEEICEEKGLLLRELRLRRWVSTDEMWSFTVKMDTETVTTDFDTGEESHFQEWVILDVWANSETIAEPSNGGVLGEYVQTLGTHSVETWYWAGVAR